MSATPPTIYPALTYRNASAALDFLTRAFGFQKMMEVPGEAGNVQHAEMSFGFGVIMLGTAKEDQGGQSPAALPAATQSLYIYVEDIDAHYERAKGAGAEIVRELRDTEYGSREYSALDLEGHPWSFGTYHPVP